MKTNNEIEIVKQPNGKYCLFSTSKNHITHYDLDKDDIIDIFVKQYEVHITHFINETIDRINNNKNDKTFKKYLKIIKDTHGKEELKHVKSIIL